MEDISKAWQALFIISIFLLFHAVSRGWCCARGSITMPCWNRGRLQQPIRTQLSSDWRSCVRSHWTLCSRSSENTPTPKVRVGPLCFKLTVKVLHYSPVIEESFLSLFLFLIHYIIILYLLLSIIMIAFVKLIICINIYF